MAYGPLRDDKLSTNGVWAWCGSRAGAMSVRRLAGEPGRDTKPVHRDGTMLTATGLIERRAADEVAVGWDRAVTELDLAA